MNDAAGTINEIGATIRRVMGGTSGILYDICSICAHGFLIECMIPTKVNLQFLVYSRYDILFKAAYASLKQSRTVTANECKKCA